MGDVPDPHQTAQFDQAHAEINATVNELITSYRDIRAQNAATREVDIAGLAAFLLESPNTREHFAEALTVTVVRLAEMPVPMTDAAREAAHSGDLRDDVLAKLVKVVHDAESEYVLYRPHGSGYSRPHDDQIRRVITAIWPIVYDLALDEVDEDITRPERAEHERTIRRAEQAEAERDRLRALTATCSCGGSYETYQGPEPDCSVHGAVRALNESQGEIARMRAALEEIKLRTVQRDLNRLAAAALQPPAKETHDE
jgi:hypothetical protein